MDARPVHLEDPPPPSPHGRCMVRRRVRPAALPLFMPIEASPAPSLRPTKRRRCLEGALDFTEPVAAAPAQDVASSSVVQCRSAEHQKAFGAGLWRSRRFTDCVVVCGSHEVPCHREVLAQASPVFERMLASEMRESSEQRIMVGGAEPRVVELMLEFIYCGEARVSRDDLIAVLSLADQYDVEALALACSTRILEGLEASKIVAVVRALKGFSERPRLKLVWHRLCEKLRGDAQLFSAAMKEL
mmetsp:Transcript_5698/g.17253  ORF Transcript_5698/g.17253 Transcript_5698/m.17253 type:complete len:244 (-) Transcript_5698:82-813(-)